MSAMQLATLATLALLNPKELEAYVTKKGGISRLSKDELDGFIKNRGGFARLTGDELEAVIKHKGGIKRLDKNELEVFVRKKGGHAKLSCEELEEVTNRKLILYPDQKQGLETARQRKQIHKEAAKKGLYVEEMSSWTPAQAHEYIAFFKHPSFIPDQEISILIIVLSRPESPLIKIPEIQSEPEQEIIIDTKTFLEDKARWPHVDFRTMNHAQIDQYTQTYALTDVEVELIDKRQSQLDKLLYVNQWDHQTAMDFVIELQTIKSVDEKQIGIISRAIELPSTELIGLITEKEIPDKQKLIDDHLAELKKMALNHTRNRLLLENAKKRSA